MGIGKLVEEIGGALAAEQAAVAADPNAGLLVKAGAAAAGFVGASKLSDALEAHTAKQDAAQDAAQDAQDAAQNAANADPNDTPPEPK